MTADPLRLHPPEEAEAEEEPTGPADLASAAAGQDDADPDGADGARRGGRRGGSRPAASLLEIAPKPRRRRPDAPLDGKADGGTSAPAPIPGLPPTGKRDLTEILRGLNDPDAGESPLDRTAASSDPAEATENRGEADRREVAAERQERAVPPPAVRLTPVAPPPAPDEETAPGFAGSGPGSGTAAPGGPASAAAPEAGPEGSPGQPETPAAASDAPRDPDAAANLPDDLSTIVFEDAEDGDTAPPDDPGTRTNDTGRAAIASEPIAPEPAVPDIPEFRPAASPPAPAAASVDQAPAAADRAPAEPRRFGWRGLAARAARVVAGSRSREADAVARRQQAVVAAVRQRDEAIATRPAAAPSTAAPSTAAPSTAAGPTAERSDPASRPEAQPTSPPADASATDGGRADRHARDPSPDAEVGSSGTPGPVAGGAAEPPVALLRRGESGLVGARRIRPGPRGPEDLIRLWLERRGARTVPAWSSFPAGTVGAQWPNSLLLTVDPEADPDGDAAAAFAAIVRLDRADRPRPAGAPRIVYTPTMTEWILALSREAARSTRMLRDRDEFITQDGRLSLTLVALPMGEADGTVDKVLCHLAADPS